MDSQANKLMMSSSKKSTRRRRRNNADPSSTFTKTMGYNEFLRFCHDFGLMNVTGLTSLECGDIYLSTIATHSVCHELRNLTLEEFWEILVRCALTAFRHISAVSVHDKIKGMFMFMWKHLQSAIPDTIQDEKNTSVSAASSSIADAHAYKSGLLRKSGTFAERFLQMWSDDEYRDYLQEIEQSKLRVTDILQELGSMQQTVNFASEGKEGEEGPQESTPQVDIMIEDEDDLGDERIDPMKLKRLLKNRKDLVLMLYRCIVELEHGSV